MVVDLPAPLGPRKPSTSPLVTVRSIPDTAVIEPNFLLRPWMMIMAAGGSKGPCNIGGVPLEKSGHFPKSFLCSRGLRSRHACAIAGLQNSQFGGDDVNVIKGGSDRAAKGAGPTECRPRKGAGGGDLEMEIDLLLKVGRSRKPNRQGLGGW